MPSIPQHYSHSITLHNGDHVSDKDRICDIGADAILAARRAINALPNDVPIGNLFSDMNAYSQFSEAVKERRILEDGFAKIVADLFAEILIIPEGHPLYSPLEKFEQAINDALYLSDRFLDLVAADKARGQGLPFLDIAPTDPTQ